MGLTIEFGDATRALTDTFSGLLKNARLFRRRSPSLVKSLVSITTVSIGERRVSAQEAGAAAC
jgi:hypothetical protein